MRDLKARARAGFRLATFAFPLPSWLRTGLPSLSPRRREREREGVGEGEREGERGRERKQIHSLTLCTFIHSIYTLTHRRRARRGKEASERGEGRREARERRMRA